MNYLDSIQERVTGFVVKNSKISKAKFTKLMTKSNELIMDLGTAVDGETAVQEGLIDQIGCIGEALEFLYDEIVQLLEYNKKIRHIRGGQKTKEKYAMIKSSCR